MRRVIGSLLLFAAAAGCQTLDDSACVPCGECPPAPSVQCCHYHRHVDDWRSGMAARRCARIILEDYPPVDDDFRAGFLQAYVNCAHGSTSLIPPVPPSTYWHAYGRSACGRTDAHQWFAGYAAGMNHAQACGCGRTLVPSSGSYYSAGPRPVVGHVVDHSISPYGCPMPD